MGFVQVLPRELDDLADELGLDFDDIAVVRGLRDAADWYTGPGRTRGMVPGSLTELAGRFRTCRSRLRKTLARLEAKGVVTCEFVRGHDGCVVVLVYDRLVRSARQPEDERPGETPPVGSERTSHQARPDPEGPLGSERTSARQREDEPRQPEDERPGKTSPRPVDEEDSSSSTPPQGGGADAAARIGEEEELDARHPQNEGLAACEVIAQRVLDSRADDDPVRHPRQWLRKTANDRFDQHQTRIDEILASRPTMTVDELADTLEPAFASSRSRPGSQPFSRPDFTNDPANDPNAVRATIAETRAVLQPSNPRAVEVAS